MKPLKKKPKMETVTLSENRETEKPENVRKVRRGNRKITRTTEKKPSRFTKTVKRANAVTGGAKDTVGSVGNATSTVNDPNAPPIHLIGSGIALLILIGLFVRHGAATAALINGIGGAINAMIQALLK